MKKKISFFASAFFRQPPCCYRLCPLEEFLVWKRICLFFFWLSKLSLEGSTVPADLVTLYSPDQQVARHSFLFLLLQVEISCKMVVFISKRLMLSGSVHVPSSQAYFFVDIFLLLTLQHLFQIPHFAVTFCFPASSPAGRSGKSSCDLFSFQCFLSAWSISAAWHILVACSLSLNLHIPEVLPWNFDAAHYLISFNVAH